MTGRGLQSSSSSEFSTPFRPSAPPGMDLNFPNRPALQEIGHLHWRLARSGCSQPRSFRGGRELHIDILSGEVAAPDDVKYKFAFVDSATARFPWIKFEDVVFSPKTSLVQSFAVRNAS